MHHLRILREGLLAAPLGDDGIGEPAQDAAGRVADPTGVLMQRDIEDVVQRLDPPVGPDLPSILARCQRAGEAALRTGRVERVAERAEASFLP